MQLDRLSNLDRINLTPAQGTSNSDKDIQVSDPILRPTTPFTQPDNNNNNGAKVQYSLLNVIGKGSFGVVYKAVNKTTNQIVAIKQINYDNDEELNDIMYEINLLKNLNHKNIVKYHGFMQKFDTLYILLEYCNHGSLKNLISPNKGLEESIAKDYIIQTLEGLVYLHSQGVIHRDIKAANLLLDLNNVVKLADFGVSTRVNNISMAMTLVGSLNWMAPEILFNKGASTLSDIWSLGATVVELITGNPPFHNLVDINIFYAIENDHYIPPDNLFSENAKDFLNECFQKNMYRRPTAKNLLKHKWLSINNESDEGSPIRKEVLPTHSRERNAISSQKRLSRAEKFDLNINKVLLEHSPPPALSYEDYLNPNKSPKRVNNSPLLPNSFNDLSSIKKDSNNTTFNEKNETTSDNILNKIIAGPSISNISSMFKNFQIEDIVLSINHYLSVEINDTNRNATLSPIFQYDADHNNFLLKNKFFAMGGLSLIIDCELLIINCFQNFLPPNSFSLYKKLIELGIMNGTIFKNFNDQSLKLHLVFTYLEVTSMNYWSNWLFQNFTDFKFLTHNNFIHKKLSQTLILKLLMNTNWYSTIFLSDLSEISPRTILSSKKTFYFIFKTIIHTFFPSPGSNNNHNSNNINSKPNLILSSASSSSIASSGSIISSSYNKLTPVSSSRELSNGSYQNIKSTPGQHKLTSNMPDNNINANINTYDGPNQSSSMPGSKKKSQSLPTFQITEASSYLLLDNKPRPRTLSNHHTISKKNTESNNIPKFFYEWVYSFLLGEPLAYISDLKYWKYYINIWYNLTLENDLLTVKYFQDLENNANFIKILHTIIESDLADNNNERINLILTELISICLKISEHLYYLSSSFFEVIIKLINSNESLINQALPILVNCFHFIMINRDKWQIMRVTTDMINIFSITNNPMIDDFQNMSLYNNNTNIPKNQDKTLNSNNESNSNIDMDTNMNNIILKSVSIMEPFFKFSSSDITISSFFYHYNKLLSFQFLDFTSYSIIDNEIFLEYFINAFQINRNSTLIQIEILKFLKTLFKNATEFGKIKEHFEHFYLLHSNPSTTLARHYHHHNQIVKFNEYFTSYNEIYFNHCPECYNYNKTNQSPHEIRNKLKHLLKFFKEFWGNSSSSNNNNYNYNYNNNIIHGSPMRASDKVIHGSNSILVNQLCEDLRLILYPSAGTN